MNTTHAEVMARVKDKRKRLTDLTDAQIAALQRIDHSEWHRQLCRAEGYLAPDDPERVAKRAPDARPTATPARRNVVRRPYQMAPERRAAYERLKGTIRAAIDAGDPDAMEALVSDEAYRKLAREFAQESTDAIASKCSTAALLRVVARAVLDKQREARHATSIAALRHDRLAKRVVALEGQLLALRVKLAEVEARPAMEYRGHWTPTETYVRGNVVTVDRSMWVVRTASTKERPGTNADWQQCAK